MIRFDHFMQTALYHPERGYYRSRIKSVGTGGDFTTSPQLSSTLARAIAKTFQKSGLRHLIEIGPGTGILARDVWRQLSFLTKRRSKHHLVEISEPLQKLQALNATHAHRYSTIEQALLETQGEAFLYSNELVDAFPVRIFRREKTSWSELYLTGSPGALTEVFQPTTDLPVSSLFEHTEFPFHQRIEVHESYHHWLQEWLPQLRNGQLLTIDYAAAHPRLLTGTLRGYFLQQRLTGGDLYQNAGHIDLTADVHFDDLEQWSSPYGLETTLRTDQAHFLNPFIKNSPNDHFLTDPDGAGSAFQVLLQQHNPSLGSPSANKP